MSHNGESFPSFMTDLGEILEESGASNEHQTASGAFDDFIGYDSVPVVGMTDEQNDRPWLAAHNDPHHIQNTGAIPVPTSDYVLGSGRGDMMPPSNTGSLDCEYQSPSSGTAQPFPGRRGGSLRRQPVHHPHSADMSSLGLSSDLHTSAEQSPGSSLLSLVPGIGWIEQAGISQDSPSMDHRLLNHQLYQPQYLGFNDTGVSEYGLESTTIPYQPSAHSLYTFSGADDANLSVIGNQEVDTPSQQTSAVGSSIDRLDHSFADQFAWPHRSNYHHPYNQHPNSPATQLPSTSLPHINLLSVPLAPVMQTPSLLSDTENAGQHDNDRSLEPEPKRTPRTTSNTATPKAKSGSGGICMDCPKSYRIPKDTAEHRYTDGERRRCKRCRDKWNRAQARNTPPNFQYIPGEATYENAHRHIFRAYQPVNIPDDDFQDHEDAEKEWVQRFIDAVKLPYDGNNVPTGMPDPVQDKAYKDQQQVLNQKPYQNPGGKWYKSEWINRRMIVLFHAAINFHKGGERPYAHGGDNTGYGNPDKKLKCSARLAAIESILQIDKRTAINMIEGRGVCALAENPKQFAKRKVQNKSSNHTKKQQIDEGKLKQRERTESLYNGEDDYTDGEDDDQEDEVEEAWEQPAPVRRNLNVEAGEGPSTSAAGSLPSWRSVNPSASSSRQSGVIAAQSSLHQQPEARKRKAYDQGSAALPMENLPKRGRTQPTTELVEIASSGESSISTPTSAEREDLLAIAPERDE